MESEESKIVKICRKCGPLIKQQTYKDGKCRICSIRQAAQWAKNNKEKRNIAKKEWADKNKDKIKAYRKQYKKRHYAHKLIKDREYGKKYFSKNRSEINKISLDRKRKEIKELHNTYIKTNIAKKYKMKASEVPMWMVEVIRPVLAIKRKIKELKK